MMKNELVIYIVISAVLGLGVASAATNVPTEIQAPGTQPGEVGNLELPDKCDNCHGGYNKTVEPAHIWRGSMMAQAARDPIYWATMAIAEQDFDGAGDLCLRCHTQTGWLAGRSVPTDGSALTASDADGVVCDLCHRMTNPDSLEHTGVQNPPFIANDELTPPAGYYGGGMFVITDVKSMVLPGTAGITLIAQIAGFLILVSGAVYARRKNFLKHAKMSRIALLLGFLSFMLMGFSLASNFLSRISLNFMGLLIVSHAIIGLLTLFMGIFLVFGKKRKKTTMKATFFAWALGMFIGILLYSYLWSGPEKLGPYNDAVAEHQFMQSKFQRSADFCGTCHDPSNPVVGDLANNGGAQPGSNHVLRSGIPGSPVDGKAAFNNFPYKYGIVERTYSEHKASLLSAMLVSDYNKLPAELQDGAPRAAYESAIIAGTGGNYSDGTPRYFSCQTCHMRPVTGTGAAMQNAPVRKDLPLHDLTGGNYWIPDAIKYLDSQGKLRLGGLTTAQIAALDDGKTRAMKQLGQAASLSVSGNTLKVINLAGHKLITGYPEGRRMWLNIKWYDGTGTLLREDGKYGKLTVNMPGVPSQVDTILNLNDSNTKIYETGYAMTQEWGAKLLSLGYNASLPLSYNRTTGGVDYTLGQLAAQAPGTYHETFRFIIDYVARDNRIPPYGMSYDEARIRNALPVPSTQYGGKPGGRYNHWDEIALNPPAGATDATIYLLYQPTSWEYIQFLYLANNRQNTFLANEGSHIMEAWLNTGMAAPYVMASTEWGGIHASG
ncbi:MAG TPA: hypothetical protein VN316_01115 [candidate division Zixibacteria bacterium]|nr:hypothetical protein [candidate division Zixibacteria bacterium]